MHASLRSGRRARVAVAGLPGTIVRAEGGAPRRRSSGPRRRRLRQASLDQVRTWLPGAGAGLQRLQHLCAGGRRRDQARLPAAAAPTASTRRYRAAVRGSAAPRRSSRRSSCSTVRPASEWVHFTDPVLNSPPGHFREVCRRLIERRVPVRWTGFFREDVLSRDGRPAGRACGLRGLSVLRRRHLRRARWRVCTRGSPERTS